ncbi:MAG: hypothetical protein KatS3mg105_0978 [Gemmatales bacterium]|nr:MAG: hypothetical protein KatS3mg105_0978 [Gemmatales bacterium]
MPTYEYACDACDHHFDAFQSMTEKPLRKCPECGKPKLRRLFGTGSAVLFKGSGFYETDYRSESYKAGAKKEAEAAKAASNDSAVSATTTTDTGNGKAAKNTQTTQGKSSKSEG